jgi:ubiquinone biosynthesis protein COQ9
MAQMEVLLKRAFARIPEFGFTRHTLALCNSVHGRPDVPLLSDTAVTALFGPGDEARRTLIRAWMQEGRAQMAVRAEAASRDPASKQQARTMQAVLLERLKWNIPVLDHLKDVSIFSSPVQP